MISVIVPIYNVEAYLPRCIESILHQTYANLEVLLIDDGSTDGSGRICDEYCKKDSRCKVIHQENKCSAGARNTGLDNISGEYVTFIDSDDWLHPLYLEYLYRALDGGRIYKIAMCQFEYCLTQKDEYELSDSIYTTEIISQDILMQGTFYKKVKSKNNKGLPISVVWGKLYCRDILRDIYFKDIMSEDLEYNCRLFLKVQNIVLVPVCLYYWISRPNSLSRNSKTYKYYNRCGEIQTRYKILESIPADYRRYRGYALVSLYKSLLFTRYNISRYDSVAEENYEESNYIKRVERDARQEFRQNRTGSAFLDLYICFLIVLYACPSLYGFLRRIMALA